MRRIHMSKRKEKEAKRQQRKREAERIKRIERYCGYLIAFIVMAFCWGMGEINFINYYSDMSGFCEDSQLVVAELVRAENYDKTTKGKYSRFKPSATKDLTLRYELDGTEITRTYENVYVLSSEANTDKYTHIYVYVLNDGSDVQTKWVMDDCMDEAKLRLVGLPIAFLGIWLAGIVFIEVKVRRKEE